MSDNAQWYFVVNDGKDELTEYESDINVIIEKAYRNQDKEVQFQNDAGTEFTINFNKMTEYPTVDTSDFVTVIRKDTFNGIYVLYFL